MRSEWDGSQSWAAIGATAWSFVPGAFGLSALPELGGGLHGGVFVHRAGHTVDRLSSR